MCILRTLLIYVQENSALDWAAKERGTSVYLADRVIPMLPRTLSNGMCSLNAGEDRLALSCLMDIDEKDAGSYEIVESVICVNRRISYPEVQEILDGKEETREACREAVPMLEEMAKLSKALRKKRRERGAVDFDFPESKIKLDSEGCPVEILPYERNDATKLIEDFMLAANETVAQHFYWLELPFLYRVHDTLDGRPDEGAGGISAKFRLSAPSWEQRQKEGKEVRRMCMSIQNSCRSFWMI